MHQPAMRFVLKAIRETRCLMPRTVKVLELGSFDVNGSVRPAFASAKHYIGVDLRPGPGVDVAADAATYRAPWLADVVVCCETLEHSPNAFQIVRNAYANLGEAGTLILTAASDTRRPHGNDGQEPPDKGEFYMGISEAELAFWLKDAGFREQHVESDGKNGDVYAWAKKGG